MKYHSTYIWLGLLLVLSGCASPPKPDYQKFYEHHPRTILVLPPANKTTAVDAPPIFLTTVTRPFEERGYYVIPIYIAQDILTDLGLTDEGLIAGIPPQQFKEFFGADAVLYTTLTEWSTTYIVLASMVTVEADYRLVDTMTGEVIWHGKQRVSQDSGGGGGGNIIASLVVAAVKAAINTATDYRPLASRANQTVINSRGTGLPAGPHHGEFQKDQEQYN